MKSFLLLISVTFLITTTQATPLTGIVKSEDGKPLAGVQIETYAPAGPARILGIQTESSTKHYEVVTKADGTFSIPSHGRIVYFHRNDLRPLTRILELTAKHVEITMEEGSRTLWTIPPCNAEEKSTHVGIGFMLKIPDNVLVKKDEKRFEEGGYFFGYRAGQRVEMLVNWWGSTSLQPQDEYLLNSPQFSQRMWKSGDKWGYEFRGTASDGKTWRRIALKNGAITYQQSSKEAAKVFDAMLDSMCFDESAVKW